MNVSNKYHPYKGYGTTQGFAYVDPPKRVRTRSDWREPHCLEGEEHRLWCLGSPYRLIRMVDCPRCGKTHCAFCGCYTPWKRSHKKSTMSVWEKRYVHRQFRQQTRAAIRRELAGDDGVSYNVFVSGDYLD